MLANPFFISSLYNRKSKFLERDFSSQVTAHIDESVHVLITDLKKLFNFFLCTKVLCITSLNKTIIIVLHILTPFAFEDAFHLLHCSQHAGDLYSPRLMGVARIFSGGGTRFENFLKKFIDNFQRFS